MSRLQALHAKTVVVEDDDLPFNAKNVVLSERDLRDVLAHGGLRDLPFRNINVYRTAFVHKSYVAMKRDGFADANERCPPDCVPLQQVSYERLEYLGDSVLGCVVARYLCERYPDQTEGFLSRMRTKLVNGRMLGSLASQIGLNRFAILSKQSEAAGGRESHAVGEDIFEAFIGAILTDFASEEPDAQLTLAPALRRVVSPLSGAGFQIAEAWIVGVIESLVDFADMVAVHTNHKELLVKHMSQQHDAPRLSEVSIQTRNGKKSYTYSVRNKDGAILGTGTGATRKDAENDACREALLKHYGLQHVRSQ